MNCSQVRAMLAIYREYKDNPKDVDALHAHLEACPACQDIFAQYNLVTERIQSLPTITLPPAAQTKLLQALATEHLRFIQHASPTASVAPPPAFLKTYIQEQTAHKISPTEQLLLFSSADTGPLSRIQSPPGWHFPSRMNQMGIIGIAAAFLLLFMIGGITSLVLLAHNGISSEETTVSVERPAQVTLTNYTISTPYIHVTSAVTDSSAIYYTAYGDNTAGWMLERFDRQSKVSMPLLPHETSTPLIVLGSSKNWLIWLELGALHPKEAQSTIRESTAKLERSWSLQALYLGNQQQTHRAKDPITLQQDTFDQATAPAWIHIPIQGAWFIQDKNLLTATIDQKGNAHLWNYQLDPQHISAPTQIAHAENGHILTSPTANSDGSNIYWAEEWFTDDNVPHGNIWTQQASPVAPEAGREIPRTVTNTYAFRTDETSFHPQVVNNTLFLLSTNPANVQNTDQASPQARVTATSPATTPIPTSPIDIPVTSQVDSTISIIQPDALIQGTLMAFTADASQPRAIDSDGMATDPQAGARFLLWQNSTKGFQMYDAIAKSFITVNGVVPKDATFVSVNGGTAIWIEQSSSGIGTTPTQEHTVTFSLFDWPPKMTHN